MKHLKVLASSSNPSFLGKNQDPLDGVSLLPAAVPPHEPAMCSAFFRWGCTFVYQSGSCEPLRHPEKDFSPCHHQKSSINEISKFQWHHHYAIIIVLFIGHIWSESKLYFPAPLALLVLRRSGVEAPFTDFVADKVPVVRDAHVLSGTHMCCQLSKIYWYASMMCVCVSNMQFWLEKMVHRCL